MNAWTHQKVSAAFSPQQYLKLRQECTSFLATIALIFRSAAVQQDQVMAHRASLKIRRLMLAALTEAT